MKASWVGLMLFFGSLWFSLPTQTIAQAHFQTADNGARRIVSDTVLLPDWLRAFDGDAVISIGRLSYADNEIKNLRVPIRISKNKLVVVGDGRVGEQGKLILKWRVNLDERSNEISIAARRIDLNELSLLSDKASGLFDLTLDINGDGVSLDEILSDANAVLMVDVGQGTLDSNDLERAGSNMMSYLVAGLNPFTKRAAVTAFKCSKTRLNFIDGKANAERMFGLQTEHFTMMCGGMIDLATERSSLKCQPRQHFELAPDGLSVVESIDVGGTFAKPTLQVNKLGLLERGASLGAGITGLGLNQIGGILRREDSNSIVTCDFLR
jgi:uncharacterized protein involved in outer membrane biogenesis